MTKGKKNPPVTPTVAVIDNNEPGQHHLPAPYQPLDLEGLIKKGMDSNLNVDVMERLLAMRKELKAEHAQEVFNMALAAFQSECPIINKTKGVKTNKGVLAYKYAPLDVIIEQVRGLLQKHGFSYTIEQAVLPEGVRVSCKVIHREGHSEIYTMQVPLGAKTEVMNFSQVTAAATTFAKRYAFCNAFGILTGDEDTDGRHPDANTDGAEVVEEIFHPATTYIKYGKHLDPPTLYKDLPKSYLNWIVEKGKGEEVKRAKLTIEYLKHPQNFPVPSAKPAAQPAAAAPAENLGEEVPFQEPEITPTHPVKVEAPPKNIYEENELADKGLADPSEETLKTLKTFKSEQALLQWGAGRTYCNKNQKFREAVVAQQVAIRVLKTPAAAIQAPAPAAPTPAPVPAAPTPTGLPWLSETDFKDAMEKIRGGDVEIFPKLQTTHRIKSYHQSALQEAHDFSVRLKR